MVMMIHFCLRDWTFWTLCCSKSVQVRITDNGEFSHNKNFLLELGEPRLLDLSQSQGVGVVSTPSGPAPSTTNL